MVNKMKKFKIFKKTDRREWTNFKLYQSFVW